jgi:hypothetical protein
MPYLQALYSQICGLATGLCKSKPMKGGGFGAFALRTPQSSLRFDSATALQCGTNYCKY